METSLLETYVLKTPPGVICKGRKKTKPVPDFPKQFYYRQELFVSGIVTYIDVSILMYLW